MLPTVYHWDHVIIQNGYFGLKLNIDFVYDFIITKYSEEKIIICTAVPKPLFVTPANQL